MIKILFYLQQHFLNLPRQILLPLLRLFESQLKILNTGLDG